jgi:uncharacterized membrane protein
MANLLYPSHNMPESQLSPARMEAFSDGVIAVIITIMVLELKVPSLIEHANNLEALRTDLPLLLVYLLSFLQTGIYWVNHHYLLDDLEQVTHGILWTNLALLFSLSLIPLGTEWLAIRGITPFSVALYAIVCALPGLSWIPLSTLICHRADKPLAGSLGQQLFSFTLYIGAIPMAYVSPYIALGMIALVAVPWLLPPKKILELTRPAKEIEIRPLTGPSSHRDSR